MEGLSVGVSDGVSSLTPTGYVWANMRLEIGFEFTRYKTHYQG
jgi:hypothetical protein